jgi:phage protein D
LLKKLAERNYFKYYVDEQGTLHFAEPNNKAPGVVTLSWGESLLSFKPEANLAAQVSAVEVYGWDPNSKQAIVGKARAGEESGKDPSRNTGGQRIRRALNRDAVLQVRQPVFTQAEATRRAQAILDDHAKNFLTGDAECIGLPDLRPDMNITLGNLGAPFSKTYYLQEATHKVDGNGYRTTVKVQETSL